MCELIEVDFLVTIIDHTDLNRHLESLHIRKLLHHFRTDNLLLVLDLLHKLLIKHPHALRPIEQKVLSNLKHVLLLKRILLQILQPLDMVKELVIVDRSEFLDKLLKNRLELFLVQVQI